MRIAKILREENLNICMVSSWEHQNITQASSYPALGAGTSTILVFNSFDKQIDRGFVCLASIPQHIICCIFSTHRELKLSLGMIM